MRLIDRILPIAVFILIIYIFLTKMKNLENEFGKLIKIVGSLKFKQFQHENQLLERSGVYVPEDSAEFVYKILWSTINYEQKEFLEKEYKEKCPSHIPMWKYVLYNYELTTNIIQKEPFMKMSNAEDLLSSAYEMDAAIKSYSKTTEELSRSLSKTNDGLDEIVSKTEDIKKDM